MIHLRYLEGVTVLKEDLVDFFNMKYIDHLINISSDPALDFVGFNISGTVTVFEFLYKENPLFFEEDEFSYSKFCQRVRNVFSLPHREKLTLTVCYKFLDCSLKVISKRMLVEVDLKRYLKVLSFLMDLYFVPFDVLPLLLSTEDTYADVLPESIQFRIIKARLEGVIPLKISNNQYPTTYIVSKAS